MTRAGSAFVFDKFAPVAIMLIESAEHALGDPVAMSEVQPLALQLNVIVAQYVASRVLRFVAAFLSASETVAHLVAKLPKHCQEPVPDLELRTPSGAAVPQTAWGQASIRDAILKNTRPAEPNTRRVDAP
jgi:hypothetical protein